MDNGYQHADFVVDLLISTPGHSILIVHSLLPSASAKLRRLHRCATEGIWDQQGAYICVGNPRIEIYAYF